MTGALPTATEPLSMGGWWRTVGIGLRWGAIAIGTVIAIATSPGGGTIAPVIGALALTAVAAWRTVPAMGSDRLPLAVVVHVEAVVTLAVLLATGGWESPFVVYAVVPILVATAATGWRDGLVTIAGFAVALVLLDVVDGVPTELDTALQVLAILTAGAAAGWAIGRAIAAADEEHERTLGRVEQLGHVNAMLSTLHDLVRTVPAPLTVEEIVGVIRSQLKELFDADAVALLVNDGAQGRWRPVHVEGIHLPSELSDADLPEPVQRSGPRQRPLIVSQLDLGQGLWAEARSGAYLWLWMRGRPSALLVLEHRHEGGTSTDRRDTLERLGIPLALAIDNAVWFQRLRTLGAEEERQRIGAALHDRFAQSLAYIAMSLDTVGAHHPDDEDITRLGRDVRQTLADLRETLRELRLKVTDERSLQVVLSEHLDRFGDRYGLVATFEVEGDPIRPALPVEQQLLRIVQDVVNLAQRESRASAVRVRYVTGPGWLSVAVEDDGLGTSETELGSEAVERLRVVRERADAIGGSVDVTARSGKGTTVTVTIRGLL